MMTGSGIGVCSGSGAWRAHAASAKVALTATTIVVFDIENSCCQIRPTTRSVSAKPTSLPRMLFHDAV
ncbi:MAG: hypothetical protein EA338_08340 [Roseinatronobacter sp.]|nr:MAG: hypothetical protein EA338_08340 [Roseinatronobacter sp.]